METDQIYDLIVLGGGPAGYAAAIRAGQLHKKALVVEMERAGGTCLNWGCIPSKALLKSAELYRTASHAEGFGITFGQVDFDFAQVMKRSRKVADQMGGGIEFLFKKNNVDYLVGKGMIKNSKVVEITEGVAKGNVYNAEKILIATGCKPRTVEGVKVDGVQVMTSREALAMTKQPKSIAIIGAGAIGAEFAYFLNAFGTKVTLIEMMSEILPVEDHEISQSLLKSFKQQGIDCRLNTKVDEFNPEQDMVKLTISSNGNSEILEAESLLLAIGVVPNLEGALTSEINLDFSNDYLWVDQNYQTSESNIFAAGDIVGPPWLAHVATYRGIQAVNGMFNSSKPVPFDAFPGCTYCQPQVASIGITEEKAKKDGINYKVGKFPFAASGKAVAINHSEGFVKVLVGEKYGEILGAHIIGSDATELIAEYGLAMNLEATVDEIHQTIHAHPTLSEALAEAAASANGEAIHI